MQVINPKWSMDADVARISFRVPTVQEGREQCDKMTPGKLYELSVSEMSKKRSLSANSLMWAVLGEMAVLIPWIVTTSSRGRTGVTARNTA